MQTSLDIKELIHEHFKPIFNAYDTDGNSTLEKEELRKLLADCLGVDQKTISQDQLDWHFSKIDLNGDGKITFEEYFSHFFGERAVQAKKNIKSESEDDLIDLAEFRKLMEDTFRPLNITITEEMVSWNFNKIDTDSSGRISFQEYVNFVKKYNS